MKRWFDKPSISFEQPTETLSPFDLARRAYDERQGSALARARNWRFAAFMAMALALVEGVSLWGVQQAPVTRYVVPVNELGEPGRVLVLDEQYQVDKALVGVTIARFVEWVRSLPTDPVVLRKNWSKSYHHASGPAITTINEYISSLKLNNGVSSTARTVQVTNVLPLSDQSFQVHWVEEIFLDGKLQSTSSYIGLFSYELKPPTTEQNILENPLGVFVINITWNKNIDPGV